MDMDEEKETSLNHPTEGGLEDTISGKETITPFITDKCPRPIAKPMPQRQIP